MSIKHACKKQILIFISSMFTSFSNSVCKCRKIKWNILKNALTGTDFDYMQTCNAQACADILKTQR